MASAALISFGTWHLRGFPHYFIFIAGGLCSARVVHTNLMPVVLVALSFGLIPSLVGQPESVLALEQPNHGRPPFRKGDQLDIQGDAAVVSGIKRITVLDTTHWPWVLVKSEQGETWLNFDHVAISKSVAIVK